jgi:hypothetical protein
VPARRAHPAVTRAETRPARHREAPLKLKEVACDDEHRDIGTLVGRAARNASSADNLPARSQREAPPPPAARAHATARSSPSPSPKSAYGRTLRPSTPATSSHRHRRAASERAASGSPYGTPAAAARGCERSSCSGLRLLQADCESGSRATETRRRLSGRPRCAYATPATGGVWPRGCSSSGPTARWESTGVAARPRERKPGARARRRGSGRRQAHRGFWRPAAGRGSACSVAAIGRVDKPPRRTIGGERGCRDYQGRSKVEHRAEVAVGLGAVDLGAGGRGGLASAVEAASCAWSDVLPGCVDSSGRWG